MQNPVKTNVSRPLSKPRVRNPLTSKIKEHSANLGSIPKHTDSPTQVEREFLASSNNMGIPAGWGDNSWDEDYFKMIPEDTTILNSSLSSSLSSLCASRETESAKTTVEVSLFLVNSCSHCLSPPSPPPSWYRVTFLSSCPLCASLV